LKIYAQLKFQQMMNQNDSANVNSDISFSVWETCYERITRENIRKTCKIVGFLNFDFSWVQILFWFIKINKKISSVIWLKILSNSKIRLKWF
jgi:hypothetical protein